MKELIEILVRYRMSVVVCLLAIFVAITLTHLLSKVRFKIVKFIPCFILIIVGTVFLSDGWLNIVTQRGINSLYYSAIIGTSGVVSFFYALILMIVKKAD